MNKLLKLKAIAESAVKGLTREELTMCGKHDPFLEYCEKFNPQTAIALINQNIKLFGVLESIVNADKYLGYNQSKELRRTAIMGPAHKIVNEIKTDQAMEDL